MNKKWYASKTIWINLIGIIGVFTADKLGFTISPEITTSVLAVINLWLRKITKSEIVW